MALRRVFFFYYNFPLTLISSSMCCVWVLVDGGKTFQKQLVPPRICQEEFFTLHDHTMSIQPPLPESFFVYCKPWKNLSLICKFEYDFEYISQMNYLIIILIFLSCFLLFNHWKLCLMSIFLKLHLYMFVLNKFTLLNLLKYSNIWYFLPFSATFYDTLFWNVTKNNTKEMRTLLLCMQIKWQSNTTAYRLID